MRTSLVRSLVAGGALMLAAAGVIATTGSAAASPPGATAAAGHQWLTAYWHNFDNGSGVMPLSEVPSAYNLVAVAFADSTAMPGQVEFNLQSAELGGYSVAQFKADIAAIQAQGRKVILSVGGEKGNVLINSAAAADAFATSVHALMQEYGFDGVDIDLEHGISAQYTSAALHQLRSMVGSSLIITMAPQTIDYQYQGEYWKLTQNIKDILTIVNMQYYNSGGMLGCDGAVYTQGTINFLTALTCIEIDSLGLAPSQVGIGVPAVPAAAGGGYVAPSVVVNAITCLQTGTGCGSWHPSTPYGLIGGAMTWSVNWDKTSGYAWSNTVSRALKLADGSVPPTSSTSSSPTTTTSSPSSTSSSTSSSTTPTTTTTSAPDTCAAAWSAGTDYVPGDLVHYEGHVFKSLWWSKGIAPDSAIAYNIWSDQGACTSGTGTTTVTTPTATTTTTTTTTSTSTTTPVTTPTSPTGSCTAPAWQRGVVYVGGDRVSYQGQEYTAKWWTNSDIPGAAQWGPWNPGARCA